mgnify:FL=1
MIKLINYKYDSKGEAVYLSKSSIAEMRRNDEEGTTYIWSNDLQSTGYVVKETPEEILAMPNIEEGNKNIDWEQRRYEIAKHMLSYNIHYTPKELAVKAMSFADALIEELKKGVKK